MLSFGRAMTSIGGTCVCAVVRPQGTSYDPCGSMWIHVAELLRCSFSTSGLTKVTKKIQEKRFWHDLAKFGSYYTLSDPIRFYPTLSGSIRLHPTLSGSVRLYIRLCPTPSDSIRLYPLLSDSIRLYPAPSDSIYHSI